MKGLIASIVFLPAGVPLEQCMEPHKPSLLQIKANLLKLTDNPDKNGTCLITSLHFFPLICVDSRFIRLRIEMCIIPCLSGHFLSIFKQIIVQSWNRYEFCERVLKRWQVCRSSHVFVCGLHFFFH